MRKQDRDLVPVADRPVRRLGGSVPPAVARGEAAHWALGVAVAGRAATRGRCRRGAASAPASHSAFAAGAAPGLRAAEQGGQRPQVGLQVLQDVAECLCGRSFPLEACACRPLSQPKRRGQSLSGGSERPPVRAEGAQPRRAGHDLAAGASSAAQAASPACSSESPRHPQPTSASGPNQGSKENLAPPSREADRVSHRPGSRWPVPLTHWGRSPPSPPHALQ